MSANLQTMQPPGDPHVPETAFGKWFLRTETWTVHVLERALQDLERLMPATAATGRRSFEVVADVGCGYGRSLPKLHQRFAPTRLIGMDIEPEMLEASSKEVAAAGINAEFICCSSSNIALPDNSVDLLFCHQTFHHLIDQEKAIEEFFRVLKPGGVLLFAESTRRYIHSWIIRLLFAHPMDVQKPRPNTWRWCARPVSRCPTARCRIRSCGGAGKTWGCWKLRCASSRRRCARKP